MHSFNHHHHGKAGETQGLVLDWGWRYDFVVWFIDTFVLHGTLRKLWQRVADLAQLQAGQTVLDVGCGTGTLALVAKERVGATGRVSGIDPSQKQIARARSKAAKSHLSLDFQIGVIEHLPFSDQSFDVVLSTFMMHHLPDDLKGQGLSEIARVLKPGGYLVIVDAKRTEAESPETTRLGAGSLGLQDLPALLQKSGFEHLEDGEIAFPRMMGLEGVGFIKARIKL